MNAHDLAALMVCPIHGGKMVAGETRFGARWNCPVAGCDVVCWENETSAPADKETRDLRHQCHKAFDPLWKEKERFPSRNEAYKWLRIQMGLTNRQAHIGKFNKEQCIRLLEIIREQENP